MIKIVMNEVVSVTASFPDQIVVPSGSCNDVSMHYEYYILMPNLHNANPPKLIIGSRAISIMVPWTFCCKRFPPHTKTAPSAKVEENIHYSDVVVITLKYELL